MMMILNLLCSCSVVRANYVDADTTDNMYNDFCANVNDMADEVN